MKTKATNLLEQIAEWRLEAADEDSGRYFYHINEVSVLERGDRSYVIGGKVPEKRRYANTLRQG
jgi:hypothetical protein